jgi:hypothetical protein
MSKMRKLGLGAAVSALLVTSVSPAYAGWGMNVGRSWGSGWNSGMSWGGGGWGRRHRGDDDTAEVLGGILIGAVLIGAIASASKKSKQAQRDRGYDPDQYPQDNRAQGSRSGTISTEDQAVDACANATEGKGGRTASVRDITSVNRNADGWDVEGVVEMRDGWRDRQSDRHHFTCSVKYGEVDSVYIEDAKVALND